MGPPKKLILSILPLGTAGTAAVPIFCSASLPKFFFPISLFLTFISGHNCFNFKFRHFPLFTSFTSLSIDFYSASQYSKYMNIANSAEELFSGINAPQKMAHSTKGKSYEFTEAHRSCRAVRSALLFHCRSGLRRPLPDSKVHQGRSVQ